MSDRDIIVAVQRMAGTHSNDPVSYVSAIVNSVDIPSRTCNCTVIHGKTEYELTAKLMPVVDDGLLLEPAIDSVVKIIFSQQIEPFVCQYSELENITLVANTAIKFNGGDKGGMLKSEAVTEKINKIEDDLNALKNVFSTWVVSPGDGGGALKLAAASWFAQQIEKSLLDDLENKNVLNG